MRSLFIDTHSEKVTICLVDGEKEYTKNARSERSHSEVVMPLIDDIFKSANLKPQDIDEIVVVNGPGSFTGVRIGVTIAKTLAYTLNVPIKTISSLEAYGASAGEDFDVIGVADPKGMYSARKIDNNYTEFMYQKRDAFNKYVLDNKFKVLESDKLDVKKILEYVSGKDTVNPHLVNPIYIKEIDALK